MAKPKGPTSKSAHTRDAIEAAAKDLFAANGFERTSLRDIGAKAGIDPSMIIRYFGSKDALFARVAAPDLRLPDLRDVAPAGIGEALVRHFLTLWEDGNGGLPVLLRSATSNPDAAERLLDMFREQVFPAIERGGGDRPLQRAGLVASQLLGLALTRYILKIPPMVAMPHDMLVREIGATVQHYAAGDLQG
jgi:AcrR family transcriptional regulator